MNPISDKINLNLYVMADGLAETLVKNSLICFSTFFSHVNVKDGQQQRQLSINWNFKSISNNFTTVTEISLKNPPPEKLQTAPVQEKSCDIFAWGRYGHSSGRPERVNIHDAFQAVSDKKILKSSGALLVMTPLADGVTVEEYDNLNSEFARIKEYEINPRRLVKTCLLGGNVGGLDLKEKNSITSLVDKWKHNQLQMGLSDVQELVNKVAQKAFDEMKEGPIENKENEEKVQESEDERRKRVKTNLAAKKAAREAAKNDSNNQSEVLPPANNVATQSPQQPNKADQAQEIPQPPTPPEIIQIVGAPKAAQAPVRAVVKPEVPEVPAQAVVAPNAPEIKDEEKKPEKEQTKLEEVEFEQIKADVKKQVETPASAMDSMPALELVKSTEDPEPVQAAIQIKKEEQPVEINPVQKQANKLDNTKTVSKLYQMVHVTLAGIIATIAGIATHILFPKLKPVGAAVSGGLVGLIYYFAISCLCQRQKVA